MDRNGYNPSILDTESGVCYVCGRQTDTARHEIYGGANRNISKRMGFWVNLCPDCHRRVHRVEDFAVAALKEPCEAVFEQTHTRQEFFDLIGRYYR